MTATYQIVYWRDIPAQIRLRSGRERSNRQFSVRFQEAIDEAAMRARTTSSDDYLDDWRSSEWLPVEGDMQEFADKLAAEIENTYPAERLARMVANKGRD